MAKRKTDYDVPMLDAPVVEKEVRATRLKESWRPTPEQMAKARADFPMLDLDEELEKFMDHHIAKGSKMVDWYRALRTWLRNARDWRDKDRRTPAAKTAPGSPVQATGPVYNPAADLGEPW